MLAKDRFTPRTGFREKIAGVSNPTHPSPYPTHTPSLAGADPGVLVEGGANIQICQIFPKNCLKLRKFWSVRGGRPPLDPLLPSDISLRKINYVFNKKAYILFLLYNVYLHRTAFYLIFVYKQNLQQHLLKYSDAIIFSVVTTEK